MLRRAIGFLLIVKAISPFLWLLAAYLVAMAIVERFDRVSGRYSLGVEIRLAGFDEIGERIGRQLDAVAPTIEAAVSDALRELKIVEHYVDDALARITSLPPLDLSKVMPELKLPPLRLPSITLNWQVPDFPLIKEVVTAVKGAVQGVVNGINSGFSSFSSALGTAFATAMAPLREQLVANVLRQLRPYRDAYAAVEMTMTIVGSYYDSLDRKFGAIQRKFAEGAALWEEIGEDLAREIDLSLSLVETAPRDLGGALGEAATLLTFFGLFTLLLFLVFYWAGMLRDLLLGWSLMTGDHEAWKRRQAEPKQPAWQRWLEQEEQRERDRAAS